MNQQPQTKPKTITPTPPSVINNLLSEHLDGHVVLGYIAGSNQPFTSYNVDDPKSAAALNHLLTQLFLAGGVQCTADIPPNGQ